MSDLVSMGEGLRTKSGNPEEVQEDVYCLFFCAVFFGSFVQLPSEFCNLLFLHLPSIAYHMHYSLTAFCGRLAFCFNKCYPFLYSHYKNTLSSYMKSKLHSDILTVKKHDTCRSTYNRYNAPLKQCGFLDKYWQFWSDNYMYCMLHATYIAQMSFNGSLISLCDQKVAGSNPQMSRINWCWCVLEHGEHVCVCVSVYMWMCNNM